MKIVDQSAVLLRHDLPPYEFIEQVARTCYKSEDKIKPGSAEKMVNALVKSRHFAMLEHEYIYMVVDNSIWNVITGLPSKDNKFLNFVAFDRCNVISGSYRAWLEWVEEQKKLLEYADNWQICTVLDILHAYDDNLFPDWYYSVDGTDIKDAKIISRIEMEKLCESYNEPSTALPHTIRFITSRSIANELVRHRMASFAQSSQRYIDYGKAGEIEVISPLIDPSYPQYNDWHYAMIMCETQYNNLRDKGIAPQIARGVLPNDCKTEIVVTATEEEWQHIINLRYFCTTGAAHPQMIQLMELAYPILQEESRGRVK